MIAWVVCRCNGMLQLLFDPCDVVTQLLTLFTHFLLTFYSLFLLTSFLTFYSLFTHFVPHFLLTFFAGTFSMQLFLFVKIHCGSMRACSFTSDHALRAICR